MTTTHDRLYEALTGFVQTMSGEYDLSEVLYRLGDDVEGVLGLAGAGIAVIDQDDGRLRYASATNDDVAQLEQAQELHQAGPCFDAHHTQTPTLVSDLFCRTAWPVYRKQAVALGIRAVAGIPIRLGAEQFGVLSLFAREVRTWTDEDVCVSQVLANMAAGYLVHAALADARATAEQLQNALDSRVLIEQAKGVLAGELSIPIDDAFDRLRRHARSNNTNIRVVAEAIIKEGLRPT